MAATKRQLLVVRSKQFLLIARAGMSIPSYEMSLGQIQDKMMTQMHSHVSSFIQPASIRLLSKDKYLRTCKFMNHSVEVDDEHTGISLWRKCADIKKYVTNGITPFYFKCLGKDGLIPSGKSKEEILLKTRELLFKSEQDAAKNRSKNPRGYVVKEFSPDWYPTEWEVFLMYGAASEKPDKAFYIE